MTVVPITAALLLILCRAAEAQSSLTFSETLPFSGDTILLSCNSSNILTLDHMSSMFFWRADNPLMYHYALERNCTSGELTEMNKGLEIRLYTFPYFQWTVYLENSRFYYACFLTPCEPPQVPETSPQERLTVLKELAHPWWMWPTTEKVTVTEGQTISLTFRCRGEIRNIGDVVTLHLYHGGDSGFNETVESTENAQVNTTISKTVTSTFKRDASQYTWFHCYIMNKVNPSRSNLITKEIEVLYKTDDIQFSCSNDQSYWTLQQLSTNHWSLEITGPKDQDYIITCHANGLPHPSVSMVKSTDQSVANGNGSISMTIRPENEVQTVFTINCNAEYNYEAGYATHMEYVEVKIVSATAHITRYSVVALLLTFVLSVHFM